MKLKLASGGGATDPMKRYQLWKDRHELALVKNDTPGITEAVRWMRYYELFMIGPMGYIRVDKASKPKWYQMALPFYRKRYEQRRLKARQAFEILDREFRDKGIVEPD